MAAPTGLYGHVQANHRRSLLLFILFALAFQLLAAVTLFLPLVLLDPNHAPIYDTPGYVRRYVGPLFLLLLVMFTAQMWWFVGTVRRRTSFRYVDSFEEPRFCGILEPLAITAGIPVPYAAIMDSEAMTAFACGVRDGDMVVVATRGLIDGLDDEELGAVLANAIVHIRNRDTRLLAAATIFMRNMSALQKERGLKFDQPLQILPLIIFPFFLPIILLVGFWIQVAFRIAYGSRALIGISRELIADAEAVRLTHNPAALASALRKIEARNALGHFADEHAAMLVIGVTHGPLATHPTLDERIGALARTTGSMVLDESARRDTRAAELRLAPAGPAMPDPALERIALLAANAPQRGFWGAFRSVRDPDRNALGLTRRGMVLLFLSLCGIGLAYGERLKQPNPLPKLFALDQLDEFRGIGATSWRCALAFNATAAEQEQCENEAAAGVRFFDHLPGFATADGKLPEMPSFRETEERHVAAQIERGCFPGRWDGFSTSRRPPPTPLEAFLRFGRERAPDLRAVPPGPGLDRALIDYAELRLLMIDNSLHFFGPEGFAAFTEAVDNDAHRAVLARLEQRMDDPAFPAARNPGFILLVRDPLTVKPCWAERAMKARLG